jgi:hypothetical protein
VRRRQPVPHQRRAAIAQSTKMSELTKRDLQTSRSPAIRRVSTGKGDRRLLSRVNYLRPLFEARQLGPAFLACSTSGRPRP